MVAAADVTTFRDAARHSCVIVEVALEQRLRLWIENGPSFVTGELANSSDERGTGYIGAALSSQSHTARLSDGIKRLRAASCPRTTDLPSGLERATSLSPSRTKITGGATKTWTILRSLMSIVEMASKAWGR